MAQPGERKQAILQSLAEMLENPKREKITTAALASKLDVSEAALYRHFASKAQMFEGLIEFIEQTLLGLINQACSNEPSGMRQVEGAVSVMLAFAQKNPGMTKVLIGDALVNEDERLQARINQLHDRLEAMLRQSLRLATESGEVSESEATTVTANILMSFVIGRWHQFAKSGFRRPPTEFWTDQWRMLEAMKHDKTAST